MLFLSVLLLFAVPFANPLGAQVRPDMTPPGTIEKKPKDRFQLEIEHQQEKARNQERQKDIKKDTDRLLKLATELKESVDNSNENQLSLEVVRKAEEIEKLAHQVQDKMRSGN